MGPLTPLWVPQKSKEPVARKFLERRTDLIYRIPSVQGRAPNKIINQLRDIAVANKNKIQLNSAYHTSLTLISCQVIKLPISKSRLLHSWGSVAALTLPDT